MTLIGSTNEEKIWNYLISNGLNKYGAAGLMGNLYSESACDPSTIEMLLVQRYNEDKSKYSSVSYLKNWKTPASSNRSANNKTYTDLIDAGTITKSEFLHPRSYTGKTYQYGYGLCQWTSEGRKRALYELTKNKNVSISDLETQLEYLMIELKGTYSSVYNTLKNATSIKSASDAVLTKFECPADCGSTVKNTRASYGQKYYDLYANKTTATITTSANAKTMTAAQAKNYTKTLLKHYPFVYCPTLASYTTNKTPHIGDIVLFYRNGTFTHTGYVYKVSGSTYYTIEGNTSGASGVIANGGGVCKKSYSTSSYPGTKFFQPNYQLLVSDGFFNSTSDVINKIIATAEQEVGYLEKKSNSNLDSKTANAGSNNYTKYWRDIYPAYQAQAWCACFVTWIIQKTLEGKVSTTTTSTITNTTTSSSSLKKGSSGNEVVMMQKMLIACGYSCGSTGADGDFGSNTETALKKFQSDNKLTVDGIYGEQSKTALTNKYNNLNSSSETYMVKITADALNIRSGPSTDYSIAGVIKDKGSYTIVETKNNWGKLKSGVGWISLKYTKKV